MIQPLVQDLMKTLLEDYPSFLEEFERGNLTDEHFCKHELGLQLSNFPLLRRIEAGRKGSHTDDHDRYYVKKYAERFYVCNHWWPVHHRSNAESLLRFVNDLIAQRPDHPGLPALERSRKALQGYVG